MSELVGAAAIAMRKTCVMAGRAMEFLGCSKTELDRWDADGSCPHSFKVRNPVYSTMPEARKWALLTLMEAKDHVGEWRAKAALAPRKRPRKTVEAFAIKPPLLIIAN